MHVVERNMPSAGRPDKIKKSTLQGSFPIPNMVTNNLSRLFRRMLFSECLNEIALGI